MKVIAWCLVGSLGLASAAAAAASDPPDAASEPEPAAQASQLTDEDLDDLSINLAQPDFTLVALPTTLRVPRHKSAFRVTHRFLRPVTQGPFSELLENLFGFDSGALIGLEYRFGLARGLQVGFHRTSSRTIQLLGQYNVRRQGPEVPFGFDVLVTIEGENNLREQHSPALGVALSREFAERLALYAQPIWVANTNRTPGGDQNTLLLGLGARARVRPTVYLVAEVAPRLAGFTPGATHAGFAIEKRAGGHAFQLNFSNGIATTMANIARGGFGTEDWYIGFNISRKFF